MASFKQQELIGMLKDKGFLPSQGPNQHWYLRNSQGKEESIYLCTICRQFRYYVDHNVEKKLNKSGFNNVAGYILDNL